MPTSLAGFTALCQGKSCLRKPRGILKTDQAIVANYDTLLHENPSASFQIIFPRDHQESGLRAIDASIPMYTYGFGNFAAL
jgi:hypothetical protein